MRSLSTVSLADVLPANLLADPFVAAMVEVFDEEFHRLVADTSAIKLFAGLQQQPDAVLDELAWQFDVDFYDQGLTTEAKRNLIARSIYWHSIKGTPYVIERVVNIAFGEGAVEEWFEYGGQPFHFRVVSSGGKFPTGERFEVLMRMIKRVKRASAILESVAVGQSSQQGLFVGGAMHVGQHITLGSA